MRSPSVIVSKKQPYLVSLRSTRQAEVVVSAVNKQAVALGSFGRPGPQGLPGQTGPAGGSLVSIVAVEPISALKVVSEVSAGAKLCDSASISDVLAIRGVAENAAAIGGAVTVVQRGRVEDPSFVWAAGTTLFAGLNGSITDVAPTSVISRIIGVALGPGVVLVDLGEAIFF